VDAARVRAERVVHLEEALDLIEHVVEPAGQSADWVVSRTSELTRMKPEELHSWAVENDQRLSLMVGAVQTALSNLDATKLDALARVLPRRSKMMPSWTWRL
jgi:hypothetical protein